MLCLTFQLDFENCFTFKHLLMSPIDLNPTFKCMPLAFRDRGLYYTPSNVFSSSIKTQTIFSCILLWCEIVENHFSDVFL